MLLRHHRPFTSGHGARGRAAPPSRPTLTCRPSHAFSSSSSSSSTSISTDISLQEVFEVAKHAAAAGALVVNDALDKPRSISYKGATDLVTETDRAAEEAILEVLKKRFPDHAILGEEGGVVGNPKSEYLWVVDPIDGTTNFAHNYQGFAVSVGVLHKAVPVAGCVIEFVGGPHAWDTRTFAAVKGGGATCNGRTIHVSDINTLQRSLLVTGFGYDHDAPWSTNMELFKDLTDIAQGVRRLGAAAVDLCHVAVGSVEAYWEYRLKPWDVTAGVVIVEEAGGRVTTMEGEKYSVFSRSMMATNGLIHDALVDGYTGPRTKALREGGVDMSPWYKPKGYME